MPDMFQVNLSGIDFEDVDLSSTVFHEPNFIKANLQGAILEGSQLYGARLMGTNLTNARLSKANINRAYFKDTLLINSNLEGVEGLNTCNHIGESIIDVKSISSFSEHSEPFLRGCGLLDWQIEAAKLYSAQSSIQKITDIAYRIMQLRSPSTVQYYSCFISYSHTDKEFAHLLHATLQDMGVRCWLDEHQLFPGDDLYEQIDKGINSWDKVLLCCSSSSLSSWWVDNEIDSAFEKERKLMKERANKVLALIPLDLDGFMFTDDWKNGKKQQIRSRIAADFKDWERNREKFNQQVQRVLVALSVNGHERETPPSSQL